MVKQTIKITDKNWADLNRFLNKIDEKAPKPRKIKFVWACGVTPFCEHKTKIGAYLHIFINKLWKNN